MKARWLVRLLLLAVVLGLLGLSVFSVVWGIDHHEQVRYSAQVRRLRALDTLLNEAVLRSRSGLLLSYDPIVFSVSESMRTHDELLRPPAFLSSRGAAELRRGVEQSRRVALAKADLIEQFKTENAVLRTSLHYFPILVASVADQAAAQHLPKVGARAQAVGGSILLFETTGEPEAEARVRAAQSALEEASRSPDAAALGDDLKLIGRHASIILERKPGVDALVRSALSTRTTDEQLKIEQLYSALEARALGAAVERRQWLLGLILGAVILGMLEVISSMRLSARARERLTHELRLAHAKLEEEHSRERALSAARSRFLAMTSHEIRTPLTAIASSAEMLESFGAKWGPERRLDHVRRIREAVASMERMVEDVLLIGRADAGSLGPAPAPILLNAFCEELVEALEQQSHRSHPIRYKFEGDSSVSLDERLLRHVLGNLLSNSIKYSERGSVVRFDVRASAKECEFIVVDQGIGIPAEHLPRLYLSYSRAKNTEHLPGTGLGLAVVRRAVDAQGGTIACESKEGHGTRFVVKIPRGNSVSTNLEGSV